MCTGVGAHAKASSTRERKKPADFFTAETEVDYVLASKMAKSLMHWLKSDIRLLKITEVEDIYRHNPFILTGYRDRTSIVGCLKSVLVLHNETINIWTHFLGFLFFVGLFCQDILWLIPQEEQSEVTYSDFVVLCTLIICYQVSKNCIFFRFLFSFLIILIMRK